MAAQLINPSTGETETKTEAEKLVGLYEFKDSPRGEFKIIYASE